MKIRKWNEKTKEYDTVEKPDDWDLTLVSEDMDKIINCVNCGREMRFGDGYTSHRYHTKGGFGFNECEECYFAYKPIYLAQYFEVE